MTDATSTQLVPLGNLRADAAYQPRVAGIDPKHVHLLKVSEPSTWPPLLVAPNDSGGYDVIDGFHRLEAARRLGVKELPCIVQGHAGYPEAFAANMKHGLPFSIEDRKEFARWLHTHFPDLSYREIGRRCGLNHHTVKKAVEGGHHAHVHGDTNAAANPSTRVFDRVLKLSQLPTAKDVQTYIGQFEDAQDVAEYLGMFGLMLIDGAEPYLR